MADRKEKHHYLPRFYLEGFCDENSMITTYEKRNPDKPFKGLSSSTAIQNKLYHLEGTNLGIDVNAVENTLADIVEGPAASPFKDLMIEQFPDFDGRQKLSIFFGFLMVRTPIYLKHLDDMLAKFFKSEANQGSSNKKEFHKMHKKLNPEMSDDEIEKDRLFMKNSGYSLNATKNYLLYQMQKMAFNIAEILIQMNWVLVRSADNDKFFITDNACNVFNLMMPQSRFYSTGLGFPGSNVVFPLSPDLCLLLTNIDSLKNEAVYSGDDLIDLGDRKIRNVVYLVLYINEIMFFNSFKYIFSKESSNEYRVYFKSLLNRISG